ncbi:hypothetical protein [Sphaerobacter thermophilus]|uniref:Uncharacterized protein n=1 Tax=Sphaerobacter thermophilus (strain ATCC 49802 / DSM 20745 / KCCM 41009 / NCIMB 13125 / S 6022) TaxID=479434 RepID=D1C3U6_SPHTD|nr:hypothetical protein [Sphaerobacter thermophilus]ACZ38913.1 hypothetical protein Sthe_1478 [Sphaerobacter thermophilus DSM 20745]
MSRGPGALDAIHRVAALSPERALLAAVIRQAAQDAARGDAEAAAWLRSETCRAWLQLIAPDGVDVDQVHARLLARLPTRAPPGAPTQRGYGWALATTSDRKG